jgi:ethanolamine permease
MEGSTQPQLKKVLRPIHLWAIAVGLVISGEYFGWNYGWAAGGTIGFLIATLMVTVMYVTFIFSFTELTSAIPAAGGPFTYAMTALGPWGAFVAGYATLVEFMLTPPAIAFALGSYAHFLFPSVEVLQVALGCFVVIVFVNVIGIRASAIFSVLITILAVVELLIYTGLVMPHFEMNDFTRNGLPFGWQGIFASLPFAIWFYLAIEGVAMVAEEVHEPEKNIRKGYLYGIATLVILALAVMVFTGGAGGPNGVVALSTIDYPLPAALALVMGSSNPWTKVFTSLGLFGLIASFHGTIISASRQVYAMAREGYLPRFLAAVNIRFRTPHVALIACALFGFACMIMGKTDQVIILAALGAVVMYMVSLIALLVLRKTQPGLIRPFRVPFYPVFPWTALILCAICLFAIIYYNPWISLVFFAGLLVSGVIFITVKNKKVFRDAL